jgi:hypothetical protein
MAESVMSTLAGLGGGVSPASAPTASSSGDGAAQSGEGPLVLVPAGFIADVVGGLSGTIGELTGGFFGNAKLGKDIGEAASPLIKLLPFQIIPPQVAPQSAGPGAPSGPQEALIVVPAGFLGGILGGIGGKLLGGSVDKWLGGSGGTGSTIGSTVGGVLGGILPFQVVPPGLMPASAGPEGQAPQEPLVVVPAGFFGNLLSGVAGTFGDLVGGQTGRDVGEAASPFIKLLPFQDVPPELAPQSTGPDGAAVEERMIVVPAGFFSSIVGGLAETIGGEVGGWFGDADTGAAIGGAAGTIIDMLPFHAVPPALLPASVGPAGEQDPAEKLMFVPAGLFGNLLSGLAGSVGGAVGEALGSKSTGTAMGNAASPFLKMLPFQVVAPAGSVDA